MELYKVASTVFLGLGVAAALQGRLLPSDDDFVISARGRRFWTVIDVFAGSLALVVIAAGEILALRVLTASKSHQAVLIRHSRTEIIVLLALTAGYVILQSLGQRALASAWKQTKGGAIVDGRRRFQFLLALACGLVAGTGVVLGLAVSATDPSVIKTGGPLLFLPGVLTVAGAVFGCILVAWWSRRETGE